MNSKFVDHTKMKEDNDDRWTNLPIDLLIAITESLDLPGNIRFSAVSKSWKSATCFSEEPLPKTPYLLLAEASPTVDDDDDDEEEDISSDDDDDDEEEFLASHVIGEEVNFEVSDGDNGDDEVVMGLYNTGEVIKTRGVFCLSTSKTYNIELPEAFGKFILGTNKGWLLTLGRDLKINLLHPFSKKQIRLPPMLTFPTQYDYVCRNIKPESCFTTFITKVAMSSTIPTSNDDNRPPPVVMAIYGEMSILGFARPGDEQWVDIDVGVSGTFEDIAFHKGKFYAVNCVDVYKCEIDDDDDSGGGKRGPKGTKIASLPLEDRSDIRRYLVESSSGHDLLLIVRFRRGEIYRSIGSRKYHTSKFLLWKLEYSEHDELGNWTPVTNLGNESLFIGKTSSFWVSSSETIKRNCIYFTDDSEFFITLKGHAGGHDMGIFSMEDGTIESHFTGKSRHPFSPPLWYI